VKGRSFGSQEETFDKGPGRSARWQREQRHTRKTSKGEQDRGAKKKGGAFREQWEEWDEWEDDEDEEEDDL